LAQREHNSVHLSGALKLPVGWTLLGTGRIRGGLRLPLLAPDRPARDRALETIRRAGVAASPMYPRSLSQLTELNPHRVDLHDDFPHAEALADRLLTLPVYPGLTRRQLDRIAAIVSSHLASDGRR
jgi:dTDP-4-amino-4,6-dideoxygalactose transaminase